MFAVIASIDEKDIKTINGQLKRVARGVKSVVSRCGFGCPQVIETDVVIDGEKPFPTLYWLTCPIKVKAVARLEDQSWSEELQQVLDVNDGFRASVIRAHEDYIDRRRYAASGLDHPVIGTGIGGVRDFAGIKCLHAHYAHYLATGNNPIGRMVDERIAGMACNMRCDQS